MSAYQSWGRYPRAEHQILEPAWLDEPIDFASAASYLPYGQGRSYGDSCLNDGGAVISQRRLDRMLSFDAEQGILRAECGVTLDRILEFAVPRGWFLPVSPGTRFVSLAGAIANDVHGKNHHVAGTFGRFVTRLELLRSDGSRTILEPGSALFDATIGGMGLTGFITWAELRLKKIPGPGIEMESIKFRGLDEFAQISAESDERYEYTVSWLDCVSSGSAFGRGIFMRGAHSAARVKEPPRLPLAVPFDFPPFALNYWSVRTFNALYYGKQRERTVRKHCHYRPFFYPLDSVPGWNRIYGARGFLQFQCILPKEPGLPALKELLSMVVASGKASFLAVLKEFGAIASPGMMSFPRPGVTLCLDFPQEGSSTMELMRRLDDFTRQQGGALYPAKDAAMSEESFKAYYPRWREFAALVDPKFSSSFARRVKLTSDFELRE